METLTTLSSFAVVGVIVSLVVEYTKNAFTSASSMKRTVYMIVLSVVGGAVVYFFHLVPDNVIQDIVGVIAAVNTAYLFFVQYLPNGSPSVIPPVPPQVQ